MLFFLRADQFFIINLKLFPVIDLYFTIFLSFFSSIPVIYSIDIKLKRELSPFSSFAFSINLVVLKFIRTSFKCEA